MTDEPDAPKAIDLEGFLRMLPFLEPSDLMAMSAAYQQADVEARDAARAVASTAAKKRKLGDELAGLQGSIIQWASSSLTSGLFNLADARPDQLLGDVRVQAVPPLLDAATVLLLGDALDAEVRDTLFEPWSSAVG